MAERNNPKTVTLDLDNLVVKVSEVHDIEAFPQVTSCMIRVHHRGYDMDSEIWLEQIDDLVQLVDALDSYIDMKGLRKEAAHD